ncbi:hypothetical protein D3C84_1009180 [compost metagenome]
MALVLVSVSVKAALSAMVPVQLSFGVGFSRLVQSPEAISAGVQTLPLPPPGVTTYGRLCTSS